MQQNKAKISIVEMQMKEEKCTVVQNKYNLK